MVFSLHLCALSLTPWFFTHSFMPIHTHTYYLFFTPSHLLHSLDHGSLLCSLLHREFACNKWLCFCVFSFYCKSKQTSTITYIDKGIEAFAYMDCCKRRIEFISVSFLSSLFSFCLACIFVWILLVFQRVKQYYEILTCAKCIKMRCSSYQVNECRFGGIFIIWLHFWSCF